MKRLSIRRALMMVATLAALTLGASGPTRALVIAIDLDPATPGIIDASRSVENGGSFTLDVVIFEPGPLPTVFDTILLEVFYADAGPTIAPGAGGPTAGGLAGNSAFTLDLFGVAPVIPGAPLTVGPGSPLVPGGFTGQSGAIGLVDPTTFLVGLAPVAVFSLTFDAIAMGSSMLAVAGSPLGASGAALFGQPLGATFATASITVSAVDATVSGPATLSLALLGCLAAAGATARRRCA